jgi:hypothetical protein
MQAKAHPHPRNAPSTEVKFPSKKKKLKEEISRWEKIRRGTRPQQRR